MIDFFYFVFRCYLAGRAILWYPCNRFVRQHYRVHDYRWRYPDSDGPVYTGVWLLGISPVAKQRYVSVGDLPEVLGGSLIGELMRPPARGPYLRARLGSLPAYVVAGLSSLAGSVARVTTPGGLPWCGSA